jgi:hypothetical protein
MPIELIETKQQELIRLNTKNGWYHGNTMTTPRPPTITKGNKRKGYWSAPAPDEELAAYAKGYAEGASARQGGKRGPENPYTCDNVVRRMAVEQGIDPATLKLRG